MQFKIPQGPHNRAIIVLFLLLATAACGEPSTPAASDNQSVPAADTNQTLPPGFTDEPPAPPTSDTLVLSGGVLLADTPITDSVIVISEGVVIAWGRRGEVAMPNDSIGVDMRGKWIKAADTLGIGKTADLVVYDVFPQDPDTAPIGSVMSTEVDLPEP